MDLDDFFENNSISLDIIAFFQMWQDGCCTKAECLSECKKIIKGYNNEIGEHLIALMTYYWCLLKNNIYDENVKKRLESYSPRQIEELWGTDGNSILELMNKLLSKTPEKTKRKKSIISDIRWTPGDVYMFSVDEGLKQFLEIEEKSEPSIFLFCSKVVFDSPKKQSVIVYILVHFGAQESLSTIIYDSVFLPVRKTDNNRLLYQYYFYHINKNYPADKLVFLGNTDTLIHIDNESVIDDYHFACWTDWDLLQKDIIHHYTFLKQLQQE